MVGFLLGTGQTLVDTGAHSILPTLVSREAQRLERANGRLVGTQVVTQELAGPPVGGFLFSAAAWIPFAVDAVTFAAGSALVATIRGHFGPAQEALDPAGRRTTQRVEITEGLRWLAAHRVLRTTAAMVAVVNLLAAAGGAVMVLFAQEKLGLDAVGFGLLLGGSAVGGVLGSLVAARVVRVVGPARIAIWTMVGSALGFLVFGLSSDPWSSPWPACRRSTPAPSSRPAPRQGSSRVLDRHELRRRRRYIRSGASTPIRPRVLARTWRVALTSHQRALDRAWSSLRTRHSA